MAVHLNHTIVSAHDPAVSAAFLAEIVGLAVGKPVGCFIPVELGNGVTLDYMRRERFTPQHYALLVDDATFDTALSRLLDQGVQIWADPDHEQPDEVNTRWGGRGVYFTDPAGHNLELLTRTPS